MAKWFVAAKRADFKAIGDRFSISPVTARILRNRDLVTEEEIERFLHGGIEELYPPFLMKGMRQAADLLLLKIRQGKRIRIIGDYDVDGVCSTAILHRGLLLAGASADTAIPHRMRDGYGLNDRLIEAARSDGIDTILTCDNGIAAASQVQLAKSYGMTVIVTDHHEVPYRLNGDKREYLLPPADVVVDPKQEGDTYPFSGICGAVIAYKLILALYESDGLIARGSKDLTKEAVSAALEEYLELAAFATVCDVMELKDENRILLKTALVRMPHTTNPGLRALMDVCGVEDQQLSAYTIGYVLGPCLNATGRLDTAERALKLFETRDRVEAVHLAGELKELNDSRKDMTEAGLRQAVSMVEEQGMERDRVLVLYLPDCHESLAGIIAGRVRERYYRPTIVLTRAREGVKGSGRSIEAYHMYDELTKVKDLLSKYGGHRMAAGLSLAQENVEPFRRRINEVCTLTPADLTEKLLIDVPTPVSYVTMELVREFSLLEPFGNGNPRPLFAQKDLLFLSARVLGRRGNVVRFQVADEKGSRWEMMLFQEPASFNEYVMHRFGPDRLRQLYQGDGEGIRLSAAYYPKINTWKGQDRIQLVLKDWC